MENVFVIEDSLTNKISYYHLLFLLFSLPFDLFFSHIILISFAVHTLIHLKKDSFKSVLTIRTLVLQSAFWVTLICISYSSNKDAGFTELGRRLAILLIPLIFCVNQLDLKKYRDKLLLGFSLCCTLTVIYLFVDALRTIRFYHYPLKTLFSAAFTNHSFSGPIEMHATFFSLQLGVALVYLALQVIKPGSRFSRMFYAGCCIVLSVGLIQLSSKSACAAVLIAVGFVIPFFVLSGTVRIKFIVTGVLITAIAGFIISRSAAFKERYVTALQEDLSQASTDEVVDPRLARWDVALDLIGKSPVIGHGSGSEIGLLKDAYFDKKLYSSFLHGLNAHNEYLSFLLKSGIIGLLIYLATLTYGFKSAIASVDVLFITFMLLITVVSLSENMLDVDKGTIFYGLFFPFFMFSKNTSPIVKNNNYLVQRATGAAV